MNKVLGFKRIYHPYTLWEDYKAGFYDNISIREKQHKLEKVLEMFNNDVLTDKYMNKVIDEWVYSCEHNLTNESMNKIAYIGQGACCLYAKIPCDVTMLGWKLIDDDVKERSNKIALKVLKKWTLRQELKTISKNGKAEGMKTVYQMKLHLF